ncbi:MAG: hypothetical protein AAGE59_28705, partial [Cyanobacteria bacterium P01_F01_bin.86]
LRSSISLGKGYRHQNTQSRWVLAYRVLVIQTCHLAIALPSSNLRQKYRHYSFHPTTLPLSN